MMKSLEIWCLRRLAVLCLWLGRDAMAAHHWRRILALAGDGDRADSARILASIAHVEAAQGQSVAAVALLHQSLALDPAQPGNWFNLGYLLQQGGADGDAVAAFGQALALDAKLDRAWYGQALSLIALGRVEEAVEALRRNTELQPLSPYGWYQLAHAYLRLDRRDEAESVIRRVAKFEPKVAQKLERETGIPSGVSLPF